MKKSVFLFLFLSFAASAVLAQKSRVPVKAAPKKVLAKQTAPVPVTEIPVKDWDAITAALDKEDWTQAATLSAIALGKLKTDNDKKQLAQLRYFYVYAAAGKFAAGKTTYAEFVKTANGFTGQEFMMPNRTILGDCTGKVNYICAVKDNEQAVRVTATDKVATIHSFEYVRLTEKFNTQGNAGKSASLVGNLEKVETYLNPKTNIKIVRLSFDQGFVNLSPNQ